MDKVVVTGANGHLGFSVVKALRNKGYHVRATVRDINDPEKISLLKELQVEVVQANLQDPQSLDKALSGMDGLFQVAAVFNLLSDNPEEEVIHPNIEGTRNIMEAAHRAQIKKIIYTSSIAAVGTIPIGEKPLNEDFWNDKTTEPYALSKTLSEKVAWDIAKKHGMNLVTLLPATIIGPDFCKLTASLQLIQDALNGKLPMALPMELCYTDVRDVALAHVLAYESKNSQGRYIAATETLSIAEVCRIIKALRPKTKISDKVIPSCVARLLPYMDALQHKLTGSPRQMKKSVLNEYLNRSQSYNSTRLQNELQWSPRPIHESFKDTIDWMESTNPS